MVGQALSRHTKISCPTFYGEQLCRALKPCPLSTVSFIWFVGYTVPTFTCSRDFHLPASPYIFGSRSGLLPSKYIWVGCKIQTLHVHSSFNYLNGIIWVLLITLIEIICETNRMAPQGLLSRAFPHKPPHLHFSNWQPCRVRNLI